MDVLLQQIINGLVMGSMYALVALGYTMVYAPAPPAEEADMEEDGAPGEAGRGARDTRRSDLAQN